MVALRERAVFLVLGLLAALSFSGGCGPGVEPVYPVKGKLLVQGQPAAGAELILHPVGGSERLQKLRPHATCNEAGEFQLATHNPGDGVPLGTFKLTVVWPAPPMAAVGDPEISRGKGDRLDGRYAHDKASASPVEITIAAGQTEIPPIDLK